MPIERPDTWTAWIVLTLILVSTILMLRSASTELFWDEADYALNVSHGWKYLWSHADYGRHDHGPLSTYLAKLGNDDLPAAVSSVEDRLRLPIALLSSLAIGFTYWALRHTFGTSRPAALAGSGLLLFSVIRLQDTPIIGPHHLMLLFTLVFFTLGYRWRNSSHLWAAIVLGSILGVAVTAMTYAIPVALAWGVSVLLAGGTWLQYDRRQLKISWLTCVVIATAAAVALVLWPPSILQGAALHDFLFYLRYPGHATLVQQAIVESPRAAAYLYWLATLDAPILICALATVGVCIGRRLRERCVTCKHVYLASILTIMLAAALKAHIAGSRNLLLFMGVLCLAIGALFDELTKSPRILRWAAAAVLASSMANLAWLSWNPNRIPYPATDGYRAFVEGNRSRLGETALAVVYGIPILKFYAEQSRVPVGWEVTEMPWTTRSDAELPQDAKYALISELAYRYMPPDQPVRRVIDSTWKVVWSFKANRSWGLRLYERP
ncbi:MAG TPA: hypothetical protein VGW33_06490 [Terriglobia bacterium]|nr:hypothetical protein [Terriglobia bacterium]